MPSAKVVALSIGFAGQAMFFMRFLFQWIETEKKKESVIPEIFWYLSLVGGFLLLIYAILQKDMVFILGQSTGTFIYLRNIYYLKARRQEPAGVQ